METLKSKMLLLLAVALCGCSHATKAAPAAEYDGVPLSPKTEIATPPTALQTEVPKSPAGEQVGFDRNDYPGDATMAAMRADFAFTGYWLNNPPGENANSWSGKREVLKQQGWGFLVLSNGKLDAEILKAQKAGTKPAALGQQDAAAAVAAAKSEGFPPHTILFLDQEEGGRLLDEQAAYLLGWTEAVAETDYKPGVYASGQRVSDGPGVMIDTIEDIRARIKHGHLHEAAIFDAQDSCPPAPGCTLAAKPLNAAGEPDLTAWQYSQSPRRPATTKSCAKTYAADNLCYAPGFPKVFLDMDAATSSDPSHGR